MTITGTQIYPQRFNTGETKIDLAYSDTTPGQNIYIQPGPVLVYRIIAVVMSAVNGTSLTISIKDGSTVVGTIVVAAGTADTYAYTELATPVAVDATGTGILTAVVTTNTGSVTTGVVKLMVQYL